MSKRKPKIKYTNDLARRMYIFFISYDDRGAPSFVKFAMAIGATAADIENFRKHRLFDRAYRECQEIRKDYLIDRALDKRFDPSFVKHLITSQSAEAYDEASELTLHLEVSD